MAKLHRGPDVSVSDLQVGDFVCVNDDFFIVASYESDGFHCIGLITSDEDELLEIGYGLCFLDMSDSVTSSILVKTSPLDSTEVA